MLCFKLNITSVLFCIIYLKYSLLLRQPLEPLKHLELLEPFPPICTQKSWPPYSCRKGNVDLRSGDFQMTSYEKHPYWNNTTESLLIVSLRIVSFLGIVSCCVEYTFPFTVSFAFESVPANARSTALRNIVLNKAFIVISFCDEICCVGHTLLICCQRMIMWITIKKNVLYRFLS